MALDTNKMSKDNLFTKQGARVTEDSENKRIAVRDDSPAGDSTGESIVTENSENKRIGTVVYPS
jgi:hypothetical protein